MFKIRWARLGKEGGQVKEGGRRREGEGELKRERDFEEV